MSALDEEQEREVEQEEEEEREVERPPAAQPMVWRGRERDRSGERATEAGGGGGGWVRGRKKKGSSREQTKAGGFHERSRLRWHITALLEHFSHKFMKLSSFPNRCFFHTASSSPRRFLVAAREQRCADLRSPPRV